MCVCVTIEPQMLVLYLAFVLVQVSLAELAEGVGWQRLGLLLIPTCVWLNADETKSSLRQHPSVIKVFHLAKNTHTHACVCEATTPRRNTTSRPPCLYSENLLHE